MALGSLAATTDLPTAWQSNADAQRALDIVSASIRDAAGVPISEVTATVTVQATNGRLLTLPGPITAVSSVTVDGLELAESGYEVLPNGLWRRCGWGEAPVPVVVACTFGLPDVPADVVDMAARMAVAWLQDQAEGSGWSAGLTSVRLDDAAETYSDEAAGQGSPVFIPEATRNWLARRFGGGVFVVETL